MVSPGTPVSSTNKADRHGKTEILLKEALDTITLTLTPYEVEFMQNLIKDKKNTQVKA